MIGVILWSSLAKEKALIWCEDHAALAYLQGRDNLLSGHDWPEAGDLVELDSETIDGLRYARGVSLVSAPKCSELPELLKGMAAPKGSRQPVLRVISNKSLTSDASPLPPHRVAAAG